MNRRSLLKRIGAACVFAMAPLTWGTRMEERLPHEIGSSRWAMFMNACGFSGTNEGDKMVYRLETGPIRTTEFNGMTFEVSGGEDNFRMDFSGGPLKTAVTFGSNAYLEDEEITITCR